MAPSNLSHFKHFDLLKDELAGPGNSMKDIEWFGIREVREVETSHCIANDVPQHTHKGINHGVMIEVMVSGQIGAAATSSLHPEGISQAARRAYQQAKQASRFQISKLDPSVRPNSKGVYRPNSEKTLASMRQDSIQEFLLASCKALARSSKIISREANLQTWDTEINFMSSSGAEVFQKIERSSLDFSATAQEGPITQTRTFGGMRGSSRQQGLEILENPGLALVIETIAEQAVELLSASECPTETLDMILMPDQMMLQIHESIGHPLELDRILGDERNYAGSSFVKMSDFGHLKYGSNLLNVTFDPTIRDEFASFAYDDALQEAKREFIIKDGILLRGLGGKESELRSSQKGVATQRACSWNRPAIDRMANLNIEPTESKVSLDDMIRSIDRGVLMESNRSWSIDDYRRKFQFGCEYGKLIEKGKIVKTIRNPNYRGIAVPFWNSLKMIGDRTTHGVFGTPNCGKGEPNQAIWVGHASPACLFSNIEVFGGSAS